MSFYKKKSIFGTFRDPWKIPLGMDVIVQYSRVFYENIKKNSRCSRGQSLHPPVLEIGLVLLPRILGPFGPPKKCVKHATHASRF